MYSQKKLVSQAFFSCIGFVPGGIFGDVGLKGPTSPDLSSVVSAFQFICCFCFVLKGCFLL